MSLDRTDRAGVFTRDLPGAMHRQALADRIRGGDALPLAVTRAADTEDHGVDPVAIAVGVLEPLEDEQCRPLPHHEAIGTGVERSRAGRRQCADLAELHERGHPHVVVDAPGDRSIEPMVDEALDGHAHRRENPTHRRHRW